MNDSEPLFAYILSQTRQNIEFLVSQLIITDQDGQDMLGRLSRASSDKHRVAELSSRTQGLALDKPHAQASKPINQLSAAHNAPAFRLYQVQALWGYNEQEREGSDLTFHAGDIIDVLAETNAEWWTGRCWGKEGLFPSNYVERLARTQPSPAPSPFAGTPYSDKTGPVGFQGAPGFQTQFPAQNYPAPMQGSPYNTYGGPPPQGPMGSYPPPVQQQQQQQQAAVPPKPKKKLFEGKFGNTLAHSAVGGVGFGAGSAIGSGIVNSIF